MGRPGQAAPKTCLFFTHALSKAIATQGLAVGMGMVQSSMSPIWLGLLSGDSDFHIALVLAAVLDTVPPLIPPPLWNNMCVHRHVPHAVCAHCRVHHKAIAMCAYAYWY